MHGFDATGASACAQALASRSHMGGPLKSTPAIPARGDHGGCGAAGGRLGDDRFARDQRHAAGEPAHARPRAGGDRAHRLPAQHDRARARARRHAVARPGDQRALEPVLHGRRRRGRGRRGPRRATRCCWATRARTPSTSCGSCARWPSARSTGMLLAPSVGAVEHALPYLESAGRADRCCSTASSTSALDQVGCDNEQPTARLVEHLIDSGTRGSRWRSASPG